MARRGVWKLVVIALLLAVLGVVAVSGCQDSRTSVY